DFNHGQGGENNTGVTTLVERTGNGTSGTLVNFSLSGDDSNWVEKGALGKTSTAPTVSAIATDPTFTENGNAVDLFSTVDAKTNDDGQTFSGMTLTVT